MFHIRRRISVLETRKKEDMEAARDILTSRDRCENLGLGTHARRRLRCSDASFRLERKEDSSHPAEEYHLPPCRI